MCPSKVLRALELYASRLGKAVNSGQRMAVAINSCSLRISLGRLRVKDGYENSMRERWIILCNVEAENDARERFKGDRGWVW